MGTCGSCRPRCGPSRCTAGPISAGCSWRPSPRPMWSARSPSTRSRSTLRGCGRSDPTIARPDGRWQRHPSMTGAAGLEHHGNIDPHAEVPRIEDPSQRRSSPPRPARISPATGTTSSVTAALPPPYRCPRCACAAPTRGSPFTTTARWRAKDRPGKDRSPLRDLTPNPLSQEGSPRDTSHDSAVIHADSCARWVFGVGGGRAPAP